MALRALVLPAAFAALFAAVAGCAGPDDPPKVGEQPAPPPAPPKTPAELLVGTWKRVRTEPPTPAYVTFVSEYAPDGTFTHRITDPLGHRVSTGTYRVEGATVRTTQVPPERLPAEDWVMTIESVTEDDLVILGPPDDFGRRQRGVYTRLAK